MKLTACKCPNATATDGARHPGEAARSACGAAFGMCASPVLRSSRGVLPRFAPHIRASCRQCAACDGSERRPWGADDLPCPQRTSGSSSPLRCHRADMSDTSGCNQRRVRPPCQSQIHHPAAHGTLINERCAPNSASHLSERRIHRCGFSQCRNALDDVVHNGPLVVTLPQICQREYAFIRLPQLACEVKERHQHSLPPM